MSVEFGPIESVRFYVNGEAAGVSVITKTGEDLVDRFVERSVQDEGEPVVLRDISIGLSRPGQLDVPLMIVDQGFHNKAAEFKEELAREPEGEFIAAYLTEISNPDQLSSF